jgi:hypothetical protein
MAGDPIAVRAAAEARNPDLTVETARGETAGESCSYRRPPGRPVEILDKLATRSNLRGRLAAVKSMTRANSD